MSVDRPTKSSPLTDVVAVIDAAGAALISRAASAVAVEVAVAAASDFISLCWSTEVEETIVVLGLPSLTLFTASAIIVVTEAAISEVRTRFAARLVLAAILAAATDRRVILPAIEVVAEAVVAAAVVRVRLAARLVVAVEVAVPAAFRILT